MWKDSIVEEIHKYRYDIHAICEDIRKNQGKDGRRVVSLKPRFVKDISKKVA